MAAETIDRKVYKAMSESADLLGAHMAFLLTWNAESGTYETRLCSVLKDDGTAETVLATLLAKFIARLASGEPATTFDMATTGREH